MSSTTPPVSTKHLQSLTVNELKEVCEGQGLKKGGTKDELIDRLRKDGVTYDDLLVKNLKAILSDLDKCTSGTKPELIVRLLQPKPSSSSSSVKDTQRVASKHLSCLTVRLPKEFCDSVTTSFWDSHLEAIRGVSNLPTPGPKPSSSSSSLQTTRLVSAKHLQCLLLDDLKELCEKRDLTEGGTKNEVIDRLRKNGVTYDNLVVDHLKTILSDLDKSTSGTKQELIGRLMGTGSHFTNPAPRPSVSPKTAKRVSHEHLNYLLTPILRDLCEVKDLKKGGTKDDLIDRLVEADVTYDDLLVDDLKDILEELELSTSGKKQELIARIIDVNRARPTPRSSPKPGRDSTSKSSMTTGKYRKKLLRAGLKIYEDQEMCHIVAWANGGADHADNYFPAGRNFNRSTGNRHDEMIAFIAGLEQTKKAVCISKEIRNYSGPSAEELYRRGEEVFRQVRRQNRLRDS